MSMSEPRVKHKNYLILNPRGKLWAQEKNTTARKLMEKWGWSEGKGLGVDLQGDKDHIALKARMDCKGLGYKEKDHEWGKVHTSYESVLADLNRENSSAAASAISSKPSSNLDSEEEVFQHSSLESLSKNSHSRLHYGKFARSKDLTRLSSDEIACITGAKVAKKLRKIAEEEDKEKDDKKSESEATDISTSNILTINSGSITDYFSKKMALLKSKANRQESDTFEATKNVPAFEFDASENDPALEEQEECVSETKSKKKKKKKKKRREQENGESGSYPIPEDNLLLKEQEECVVRTGKKRKEQKHTESNSFTVDEDRLALKEQEESTVEIAPKKKKKRKEQKDTESNSYIAVEDNLTKESECVEVRNEKKIQKEKERTEGSCSAMDENKLSLKEQEEFVVETERRKKKKKNRDKVDGNEHPNQEGPPLEGQTQCSPDPEIKKRKAIDVDYDCSLENLNTDYESKRKSKKKKKDKVPNLEM